MNFLSLSINILGYNVISLEISAGIVVWYLIVTILRDWMHSRKILCR